MFNKVISILSTLILLVLAGCRDVAPISVEEPSTENRTITLNLDITSKASASPDESPTDFNLWIFNGDKLLGYISDDPVWNEIYNGGIDLRASVEAEIDSKGVTQIQFYLLLNTNVEKPKTLTPAQLKELVFTFPETPYPYTHDNKVPMSGEATLDIYPSQFHYAVRIDATRSVGKLELYFTKNISSSELYINKVSLGQEPNKGYLFGTPTDNDITYIAKRDLFVSDTGQPTEINTVLTGESLPGNIEDYQESFTKITIPQPYLLENLYGGDNIQVEGVDTSVEDFDKRYYIDIEYTIDSAIIKKRLYLTKIDRNTLNKVFIRIKEKVFDIELTYKVKPWEMVVLTPEL